jgi:hypothetical protein
MSAMFKRLISIGNHIPSCAEETVVLNTNDSVKKPAINLFMLDYLG